MTPVRRAGNGQQERDVTRGISPLPGSRGQLLKRRSGLACVECGMFLVFA